MALLFSRGANVQSSQAAYPDTALLAATKYGHGNVVRLLLDFGADTDAEVCRISTIYAAATNGH